MTDALHSVPGFPGYYITKAGRVYSTRKRNVPTELATQQHDDSNRWGAHTGHGGMVTLYVARVLMKMFGGEPTDPRMRILYRDHDWWNPALSNLYWGRMNNGYRAKAQAVRRERELKGL